jgi:hypothetical protein
MEAETITATERFARLLGMRLAARLEPDVTEQAIARMALLLAGLTEDEMRLVMVAAIDAACDMYVQRRPNEAMREAENIARTLRDAWDYGAAS